MCRKNSCVTWRRSDCALFAPEIVCSMLLDKHADPLYPIAAGWLFYNESHSHKEMVSKAGLLPAEPCNSI